MPAVKNEKWARNPIDRLVLARLEREGLAPSPEADRATLLRRLSFDLTGLPPTTAQVDAFLADKSSDAYEKQVDRLLALPQYGERMAMQWLDLSRYADTHGYHIDSERSMWKWREWVIDAFNRNMPFDRFGIEQLAGDLLPNATVEQRLASGFNRNHMINYEGGAIPEEYQVEYVADRVDTTSNVFMGLTVGCARCHDHKFDPISQKDYYRFFAFFNTVPEKGLDGRSGNAAPILEMPTAAQASEVAWLQQAIAGHEAALPEKETQPLLAAWTKTRLATLPAPPRDGLLAEYTFEEKLADSSGNHRDGKTVRGNTPFVAGRPGQSAAFNGEAQLEFPGFTAERFAVAFWMRSGALGEMTVLEGGPGFEIGVEDSHPQPNERRGSPLYVEFGGTRWHSATIIYGGQWHQVTVNFENGKPALLLDGKPTPMLEVGKAERVPAGPVTIGDPHRDKPLKGDIGGLRIFGRALTQTEAETLALHEPIRYILAQEESKRTKDQNQRLLDYFLTYDAAPELRRAYAELNELKAKLAQTRKEIVTTQVMAEMAKPRDTFILARGDYRNQTEKVTPGVPTMLPPMAKDAPANRLGLARVAIQPAASADRARGGQPLLATAFRRRPGEDHRGFRIAGRRTRAARCAGLAGHRVSEQLGREGPAAPDRDIGHLPAVFARQRRTSREGPGEPLAGARSALPAARRDGARQCARRERPAQSDDRRPERLPLPAARALGGTVPRRDVHRAGVSREHGTRPLPAQHVYLLEAHGAARRAHYVRCAGPREMHLAPPDHQYAVAGPGAAQRSDLCGSGARAGATRDPGGARRCLIARAFLCSARPRRGVPHRPNYVCWWSWRSASSTTTRKTRHKRRS